MKTRILSTLIVLVLVAGAVQADTIFLKGKSPLTNVKVATEDASKVTYTKGKSTRRQTVATTEVTGILYDNEPARFRQGVEYFSLGDYVNAASLFGQLVDSAQAGATAWLKEYAGVYLGRSYLASGQFAKAVSSFQAVLAAKKNTRWLRTVVVGLVQSHCAQNRFDDARAVIESYKTTIGSEKLPELWKEDAETLAGEVLISEKKYEDAVTHCRRVALRLKQNDPKKDTDRADLWVVAKRLEGQAYALAGDHSKAESSFKELARLAAIGFQSAGAAAKNGQAEVYIRKGEKLEQAAHLLARASVENYGAVSELPRTCYLLGLVHNLLHGNGVNDAKTLAGKYFAETVRRFPESREALLAREELKKGN